MNRLEDLSFEELLTQLMQASGHQTPAAPSSPNLRRLGKRLREIDGTSRGLPSEKTDASCKRQKINRAAETNEHLHCPQTGPPGRTLGAFRHAED
jgi:hypothetical protein